MPESTSVFGTGGPDVSDVSETTESESVSMLDAAVEIKLSSRFFKDELSK